MECVVGSAGLEMDAMAKLVAPKDTYVLEGKLEETLKLIVVITRHHPVLNVLREMENPGVMENVNGKIHHAFPKQQDNGRGVEKPVYIVDPTININTKTIKTLRKIKEFKHFNKHFLFQGKTF